MTIFLYMTYHKKIITQHDNFFYTIYRKKKLHDMTIFLYTHLRQRKEISSFTENKKCVHVATGPTYGPLLILSPALKHWGPPRQQGLCSHPAHLWATSDFVSGSEAGH